MTTHEFEALRWHGILVSFLVSVSDGTISDQTDMVSILLWEKLQ